MVGDDLGEAVAIDGDTVVVGDGSEDENGTNAGAAYVFVRSGGSWSEQQKLLADDGAGGDSFGASVDVDGDTIVVGAPRKDVDDGAVYVFGRSGGTWTQREKLSLFMGRTLFGRGVAVDGDTIVAGAPVQEVTPSGIEQGAAHVYVRSGGSWSKQAELTLAAPSDDERFGNDVALDGDTALIGARGERFDSSNTGEAHVFTRSGSTWAKQQTLIGDDLQTQDNFGWSVDLDEETALVGSRPTSESRAGAGYVFTRSGSSWTQEAHLLANDNQDGDRFGDAVTVDGDVAIVGARTEDENGAEAGAAYVFVRDGSTWSEQQKLLAADGERQDNFGTSADLDGDTAVIGAYPTHSGAEDAEGAYVFVDRS